MENETMPLTPQGPAHAAATSSPPSMRRLEAYEGPGTGRVFLRLGKSKPVPVSMMIRAARPGEGAESGDLFLTFENTAKPKRGKQRDGPARTALVFHLDIGAKRFLLSMLEQAVTIANFKSGV